MILKYNDLEIQSNHLTFEKRFKYSNNLSFIPIKYNNTDLLIQTPVLFVPFNISAYSKECNKKYLTLSFQSCCNEDFINNLLELYNIVKGKYGKKYDIQKFIKEYQYYKWMRFKVSDTALFFDQNKKKNPTYDYKK